MQSILDLSIYEVAKLYRKQELSPVKVLQQVLERQEELEPSLNAFISVIKDNAYKSAEFAEKVFLTQDDAHLLTGIPFSVKDLFYTKDILTTCGSNIKRNFVPSYSATVVKRLQNVGAVLFGKNNMLEFAYGIVHPDFGQTNNPWDTSKTAGGSSGGSAAAVAAGIGFFSLGTDTGGSIRIPASYCGVVGLKPTYGLINMDGVFPLSGSLDHVGPITKSVQDNAIVFSVIANNFHFRLDDFERHPTKKRIGILPDSMLTSLDSEVKKVYTATLKLIRSKDWELIEVDIEKWHNVEKVVMDILLPEAAQIHSKWFDLEEHYAPLTYKQLEIGMEHKAIDYLNGVSEQKEFKRIVSEVFQDIDVLITPTVAFPAPAEDPVIGDDSLNEMTFTGPFNLSGHPAVTVNLGFTSSNLPVGIQFVGKYFGENELLQIAYTIEQQVQGINKSITI